MERTKLVRRNIVSVAAAIRSLIKAQPQKTAVLPFGEMTAEKIVEGIKSGHTGMQVDGIRLLRTSFM